MVALAEGDADAVRREVQSMLRPVADVIAVRADAVVQHHVAVVGSVTAAEVQQFVVVDVEGTGAPAAALAVFDLRPVRRLPHHPGVPRQLLQPRLLSGRVGPRPVALEPLRILGGHAVRPLRERGNAALGRRRHVDAGRIDAYRKGGGRVVRFAHGEHAIVFVDRGGSRIPIAGRRAAAAVPAAPPSTSRCHSFCRVS